MEEQGIIRPGIFDQPMHGSDNIGFCRMTHRILCVVCQANHILSLVMKMLIQVCRHVANVVDAAPQLATLTEVIDPDKQRFPGAGTCRVLELVALRGSLAE